MVRINPNNGPSEPNEPEKHLPTDKTTEKTQQKAQETIKNLPTTSAANRAHQMMLETDIEALPTAKIELENNPYWETSKDLYLNTDVIKKDAALHELMKSPKIIKIANQINEATLSEMRLRNFGKALAGLDIHADRKSFLAVILLQNTRFIDALKKMTTYLNKNLSTLHQLRPLVERYQTALHTIQKN